MKKFESLSLNKFKGYELKEESHNMVLGGTQVMTGKPGGCQLKDTADDKSKNPNGGGTGVPTWPKEDITVNSIVVFQS